MKTSFYSFIECSNSLASYEIARVITKTCSVEEHLKMIEEVTAEDILEYANKIYTKDNVVTLICRGENNDKDE